MTSDHARCSTGFSGKTRTNPALRVDGVSAESLNDVDDLVQRGARCRCTGPWRGAGRRLLYMRWFLNLDGHQWSFIYMDISAVAEQ